MPGCSYSNLNLSSSKSVANTFLRSITPKYLKHKQKTHLESETSATNIYPRNPPGHPTGKKPGFHLLRRPMSVLVIGAAGAVGKRLIGALAARGGGNQKLRGGPCVAFGWRRRQRYPWNSVDPGSMTTPDDTLHEAKLQRYDDFLRFCSALNAKCYHRLAWYCFVHFLEWGMSSGRWTHHCCGQSTRASRQHSKFGDACDLVERGGPRRDDVWCSHAAHKAVTVSRYCTEAWLFGTGN